MSETVTIPRALLESFISHAETCGALYAAMAARMPVNDPAKLRIAEDLIKGRRSLAPQRTPPSTADLDQRDRFGHRS